MKFPTLTAITLAAALAAVPAIAQTNANPPADTGGAAAMKAKDKSTMNPAAPTNAGPGKQAETETPPATTATPAPAPTTGSASNGEIGTATVVTKNGNANNANTNANDANALPHQRNPVLADNGQPRAGKIIGSDVYNMQDKKVGSIDDILMGVGGQADQVVLSVKSKLVLVPFDKLIFGNTQLTGDNRVIMPDETRDALAQQPEFHYNSQNQNKG